MCSAVAFGAIPVVHAAAELRFWQLCALVAVGGLARAPGATARKVMLPELARRGGTSLERATSAFGGVSQGGCYLLVSLSPFLFRTWRALDADRCGSLAQ